MRVSDFNFDLPAELIAQHPLADRVASRMLHLIRAEARWQDMAFRDFPGLLRPDDLLVFNNTKVFPARLFGHRSGVRSHPVSPRNPSAASYPRGKVEVLLTRQLCDREWQALVSPGRKLGVGEVIFFDSDEGISALEAEIVGRGAFGERTLRFHGTGDLPAIIDKIGHIPLPPYIDRRETVADRDRYQTVYAREPGSVAAPTAGLHFTPEVLEAIAAQGVEKIEITLHVGLGTFQPIRSEMVEQHRLHREPYTISPAAAERIDDAMRRGRRIVAVGTTTARTLEYAASLASGKGFRPGSGEADIFIYPGYQFRVVGALLTNFHLPRSTLLMLVSAFAGRDLILSAYRHAIQERYRFFSYGDCMFIE